ncbi:MAG: MATE family efflux transporter [Oscillibacter sp.]|nr:MATE family efflux transporter [Oscillibacter sp.]
MKDEQRAVSVKPERFTNRQLLALIGPLLLEQFLAIGVGLADSLMVSHVGDAAISAVSLVDSISNLMIYAFSAMAAGGAAVAGQYIGRREADNANNAAQHLVLLLGGVSIAITLLLYLFQRVVLTTLFGHVEADVMAATNTYYRIVIASIPGIALYNGGAAILRTIERSDISLYVSLLMNAVNVTGNAILIFGLGMDVSGAAIPTLISRTLAACVILFVLCNPKLPLHLSNIRSFSFRPRLMRNILYIGIPSGIENGMFQLGRLVLFSLISTFTTAAIVANAIGNTLGNFHLFAGQAVNLGLTPVVSQCVGAGEYDEARYYMRKLTKVCYALLIVINLLILAALPLIMRVYGVSPEAERLAIRVTVLHGVSSMILWTPSFLVPSFLRAAGDARYTMIVSMCSMWLCRVLFAYILGKYLGYGVEGVWFAHAILDWSTRSLIFFRRYRSGVWMEKAIR